MARKQDSQLINNHPILESIIYGVLWTAVLSLALSSIARSGVLSDVFENIDIAVYLYGSLFIVRAVLGFGDILRFYKSKIMWIGSAVSALLLLTAGLLVLFLGHNYTIISVAGVIYFSTMALKRLTALIARKSKYSRVFNLITLILMGTLVLFSFTGDGAAVASFVIVALMETVIAIVTICALAFKRMQMGVLLKVVRRTYAAEVFIGLITLIAAFSVALYYFEGIFKNVGDAAWYCFAVVTTIGFGDFAAVSIVGRILTVILGMYGIVVVAVITSIIVNFYNETKEMATDIKKEELIEKDEFDEAEKKKKKR
ncbi:MAG: two pore domain potassium channel family protein [Bacilli bacterium]|nr:two pore domain potassium channel family protein [Bacilli bacterium]